MVRYLNIQEQHKDLCDTANELLKQWYLEKTGENPEGIRFFYFDRFKNISGIFQWPMRGRKYCRIVLFRNDLNKAEGYLREIFNLAHELGHFIDYQKTGKPVETVDIKNKSLYKKIIGFVGEVRANFYGIRFIKGRQNKLLFVGFAYLSLLNLIPYYFFGGFGRTIIRKVYVDWYIWKLMENLS